MYTGKNGETYTQTAVSDILVTPRVLTAEEAEALACLQHGEPKTVVADDGSVLRQMEINPKEAAQYAREIEAILNGTTVPQEETVSVFYEAHPRDEQVEVLIIFDDAPVAKRAVWWHSRIAPMEKAALGFPLTKMLRRMRRPCSAATRMLSVQSM